MLVILTLSLEKCGSKGREIKLKAIKLVGCMDLCNKKYKDEDAN